VVAATVTGIGARVLHLPAGGIIPAEVYWYAPLAAAATLLGVAALLIAIDRFAPRAGVLRLAFPLFVAVCVYSFIRALRMGVASLAAIVLAAGIAFALARFVSRRPAFLRRTVPGAAPWVVVALFLYAVAIPLTRRMLERRALAGLPPALEGAPNVLLLVFDTVRQHDVSLYGYERETTPNLTALAAKGVVFERAFATAPWSLPSHASMLTGLYPNDMTAGHRQPVDDKPLLLTELLARHGYATGGFVGNLSFLQPDFGLDRGFLTYDARPPVSIGTLASTWWLSSNAVKTVAEWRGRHQTIPRRHAEDVKDALISWVARHGDRPFFAFVNFFDAHEPYLAPAPHDTAFGRTGRYWTGLVPRRYSAADLQQMRAGYDGGIRYMDEQLQQVLTGLRELGELDHTIVIVTSDHGEEFGERDPSVVGHSLTLHTTSTLVPFVLVYPPGVPAGVRLREPVSLRDIPATVVELAKLPGESPFPGAPLARYALDAASRAPATPRGMSVERWHRGGTLPAWTGNAGDMFGVVDGDRHYFIDAAGQEHLFDLSTDLDERVDLAGRPETAAERTRLRALIDSLLAGPDGKPRARAPTAGRPGGRQIRRR
jgi:arylsulfatase A-like enzyme